MEEMLFIVIDYKFNDSIELLSINWTFLKCFFCYMGAVYTCISGKKYF